LLESTRAIATLIKFTGRIGSGFIEISKNGANAKIIEADVVVTLIPRNFWNGFLMKA